MKNRKLWAFLLAALMVIGVAGVAFTASIVDISPETATVSGITADEAIEGKVTITVKNKLDFFKIEITKEWEDEDDWPEGVEVSFTISAAGGAEFYYNAGSGVEHGAEAVVTATKDDPTVTIAVQKTGSSGLLEYMVVETVEPWFECSDIVIGGPGAGTETTTTEG